MQAGRPTGMATIGKHPNPFYHLYPESYQSLIKETVYPSRASHRRILQRYTEIDAYVRYTSSTAQGGGGSFKNRKPIGEIGCCESRMAERIH